MSYISLDLFFKDISTHVKKLLKRAADYSEKEQWKMALTVSKIALEELEYSIEYNSWNIGLILSIVGCINTKANKHKDPESLWKRVFSIFEKYDERSLSIVKILWDVFALFFKIEGHESVISIGETIIGICEKYQKEFNLMEAHRGIMQKGFQHLKQLDEAKKFLHAILPVYADKFGIKNIEVEKIFELLEIVYFWRNNMTEFEEEFKHNPELSDGIFLSSLGMLCGDENFVCKAFNYFQCVIKYHENKDLPNHLAFVNMEVGKFYLLAGIDLMEEVSLDKTHIIDRTKSVDNDEMMLHIKSHLASSYIQSGLLSEARRIYEEILDNFYTDESDVSILEWARSNERSGDAKVPILDAKKERDFIVPVLWDLSALYILDRNYRIARILQNFAEPQPHLTEHDGV